MRFHCSKLRALPRGQWTNGLDHWTRQMPKKKYPRSMPYRMFILKRSSTGFYWGWLRQAAMNKRVVIVYITHLKRWWPPPPSLGLSNQLSMSGIMIVRLEEVTLAKQESSSVRCQAEGRLNVKLSSPLFMRNSLTEVPSRSWEIGTYVSMLSWLC